MSIECHARKCSDKFPGTQFLSMAISLFSKLSCFDLCKPRQTAACERWSSCQSYWLRFISHFLFHAVQFCTHSGHRCMNDRSILSHFPVIIPHFSSFTLHYPNLATMTYFSTPSQFPRHSRSKLLHSHLHTYLSRELFILPRSGTSLIWWSYRVHKPQVWDLFCWRQENCERCGARQRIKHGVAMAFDLPFPPFLFFKGPVWSCPADARAGAPFLCHQQAPWDRWPADYLFLFLFYMRARKPRHTFFGVFVSCWVLSDINTISHA